MGIDTELRKQGYEFDNEHSDREAPAEIWINKKLGMGFRIEWFMLDEVKNEY